MQNLMVPLEGKMGENMPYFKAYFQEKMPGDQDDYKLPAIVICPGGGFTHLSPREADPVALTFAAKGYQAFVLYYSLVPKRHPLPMIDAAKTIAMIRAHAEEWHVDPDKIAMLGFSAGGNVTASLSTFADHSSISALGLTPEQVRPNAAVLCYGVMAALDSMSQEERDTYIKRILDDKADDPEMRKLAFIYDYVSAKNPPTFLWHTAEDTTVPVEHSLAMAAALSREKVPFEMHIFPKGKHGLSLATKRTCNGDPSMILPEVAQWVDLCCDWLKRMM